MDFSIDFLLILGASCLPTWLILAAKARHWVPLGCQLGSSWPGRRQEPSRRRPKSRKNRARKRRRFRDRFGLDFIKNGNPVVTNWNYGHIGKRSMLILCERGNTGKRSILITRAPWNTGKQSILITCEPGNTGPRTSLISCPCSCQADVGLHNDPSRRPKTGIWIRFYICLLISSMFDDFYWK